MSELTERCRGRWHDLLSTSGVESQFLSGKHGPCPFCGGKDRYRFSNREGAGTFFCSQCGHGDGVEFLQRFKGWDFRQTATHLESIVGGARRSFEKSKIDRTQVREWMQTIWTGGKPIDRYDPVGKYLESRAIVLDEYPKTLRYAERCRYEKGVYHPAMLAIFQGVDDKAGQLHRTFLDFGGNKANVEKPKQFMPLPFPDGGAVRLFEHSGALGIAEGIETALSTFILTGVPTWAALDTARLMKFEPPEDVKELHIFADNDAHYAGQSYAMNLAARLSHKRSEIDVCVSIPDRIGADWNDVLMQKRDIKAA